MKFSDVLSSSTTLQAANADPAPGSKALQLLVRERKQEGYVPGGAVRGVAAVLVAAGVLSVASTASGAVSATIVPGSLTQGTVQASLAGGTYATESNKLNDWPLNTGKSGSTTFAISLTNCNFNGNSFGGTANSMIAFGSGGGVTLKFDSAIHPVAGQKEFGLFTAQMLVASSGSIFNGNMEAAVLVSADGISWRTLSGETAGAGFTGGSSKLNAPTMAYDYGTSAKAWTYGSPGTTAANLGGLSIASYETPMPDDGLFNGAGTNAQRLALKSDTSETNYDAIFGDSGGGNWFDISASGLSEVNYVRLNGVNVGTGSFNGVRLDAVFANPVAVPEPSAVALITACAAVAACRSRR